MYALIIISLGFVGAIALERFFPRIKLIRKEGWLARALFFNTVQLLIILLGSYTWEVWMDGPSLFKLHWTPFWNGVAAYIIQTWVFYWWHYLRHENNFLWRFVHQFHHSPVRIEVITSFYKHPIEIILNSLIMTTVTCPILGLDAQTNAWMTIFLGYAELFYHLNVRTPRWIGWIIQRPESHLFHHQEDRQYTYNYGDLAIWDWLNGTLLNPTDEEVEKVRTGFSGDRERRVGDMLRGKSVIDDGKGGDKKKKLPANLLKACIISLLFLLGSLNMLGMVFRSPTMRGIGIVSTASPLPFVFSSYNGIETFSTKLSMNGTFQNGTQCNFDIDHKLYSKLKGPYNRRNVIGAIFSHGPFFDNPNMIKIRDQTLYWGFCKPGKLLEEFGIHDELKSVNIKVKSKTIGNDGEWMLQVSC